MAARTVVGTVEDLKASAVKTVGLDDFGTDDDNYRYRMSRHRPESGRVACTVT